MLKTNPQNKVSLWTIHSTTSRDHLLLTELPKPKHSTRNFLWTQRQAGVTTFIAPIPASAAGSRQHLTSDVILSFPTRSFAREGGSGVSGCPSIYTMYKSREESLLGRLSVNSEPIETGVFRMAPVRKNPEFHYLKSSFRPFRDREHLEWLPVLVEHKLSQQLPFFLILIF